YWQARAPVNMLERIVENGIPAYLVGGYDDVYQRGEPLVYSGFQNAYDRRPVKAPMSPAQRVTGRYQLMQGPWYHLTAGTGGGADVLQSAHLPPDPCSKDDRSFQAGPGALTYTTAPMKSDAVLAGPVDATVYASANRNEVELVATLEDVAPDGTSLPLTGGALLGSFRALDDELTWRGPDGRPLAPYHPYTRESAV